MKKTLLSFFFISSLVVVFSFGNHFAFAQATADPSVTPPITPSNKATMDQAIATDNARAASDATSAAAQNQLAIQDAASGDTNGANIAANQARVYSADATMMSDEVTLAKLYETSNPNQATVNTLQAKINADGAALNSQEASLAAAQGDVAGATTAAANAQTDAAAAQQNAVAANTAAGTGNFVALTNLPVLSGLTTAPNLAAFFNALYVYSVGIAATLAVIEIMWAGVMYMGGDSVTETKDARHKIEGAILGLVLVLSPVVVFSIISPKILNLNIGSDFTALTPSPTAVSGTPAAATTVTAQPTTAETTQFVQQSVAQPTTGTTLCTVSNHSSCSAAQGTTAAFGNVPSGNTQSLDSYVAPNSTSITPLSSAGSSQ